MLYDNLTKILVAANVGVGLWNVSNGEWLMVFFNFMAAFVCLLVTPGYK